MSIRLFIVRHAEHVTPHETQLSKVGSLQAAALAEMFKSSKSTFDEIFTSSRCLETAETIAQAINVPIIQDEKLRNWDGGLLTGLTKEQIKAEHLEIYTRRFVNRDPKFKVPQGESLQDRYNRVEEFLNERVANAASETSTTMKKIKQVIVVTHGGVIDDMFRITCGLEPIQRTNLKKPFGCLSVLVHDQETGWRDEQWAKADHLPRVVAESPTGGHLYLFPNQVSGSFPMLRGDRGELCKPATPNELACYRMLFADPPVSPELAKLRDCVPKFFGTVDVDVTSIVTGDVNGHSQSPVLSTNRQAGSKDESEEEFTSPVKQQMEALSLAQEDDNNNSNKPVQRMSSLSTMPATSSNPGNFSVSNLWRRFITDRWTKMVRASDGKRCVYLILENITNGLAHPNIMDVKVGTRQHKDTETAAKQERKAKRCNESTSATLGVRIHGISQHDARGKKMILRDKYWGRALDDEGVWQALQGFVRGQGEDLVSRIIAKLEQILDAVSNVSWRFWGSSILFVCDGSAHPKQPAALGVVLIDFGSADMNEKGEVLGTGCDAGFVFGIKNLILGFQKALVVEQQQQML